MEIKRAGRSSYGFYLQLADGTYKGCSEAVSKYVSTKTPCSITVLESEGEGKKEIVTKVQIAESTKSSPLKSIRQEQFEEAGRNKTVSVMISYAKDLACASKIPIEDIGKHAAVFLSLNDALLKGNSPSDEESDSLSEAKSYIDEDGYLT